MGAEVALRWAVVFLSLRSGSRFRGRFAAGSFKVFIPSRWFFSLPRVVRYFFLIKCWSIKKSARGHLLLHTQPLHLVVLAALLLTLLLLLSLIGLPLLSLLSPLLVDLSLLECGGLLAGLNYFK